MTAVGVTLRLTGVMPLTGLVRLFAVGTGPAGVAGLIRSMTARLPLGVSRHSLADSIRTGPTSAPGHENAVPMLAELVELVIGVDTHSAIHTAVVVAGSRAVLATAAVSADEDGYTELVTLADQHDGLRWVGDRGHRRLRRRSGPPPRWAFGELVVELDRPVRPARRAGAKSDVINAERAARDALSRTQLASPRPGPSGPACRSCSPHDAPRSPRPAPGNGSSLLTLITFVDLDVGCLLDLRVGCRSRRNMCTKSIS